MEEQKKTARDIIQDVIDKMCTKYCKYPDTFDEELEGCELMDSEICKNCPLNDL